jgi:hypothetical protein
VFFGVQLLFMKISDGGGLSVFLGIVQVVYFRCIYVSNRHVMVIFVSNRVPNI